MLVHRKKEKNKIDKDAYRANSRPPQNVPLPVAQKQVKQDNFQVNHITKNFQHTFQQVQPLLNNFRQDNTQQNRFNKNLSNQSNNRGPSQQNQQKMPFQQNSQNFQPQQSQNQNAFRNVQWDSSSTYLSPATAQTEPTSKPLFTNVESFYATASYTTIQKPVNSSCQCQIF